MNRRNVLVGLGTIVAGGGAALGTGAFSTVEADRTIEVTTTGDADAYLGIEAYGEGSEYVDDDDDEISFDFGGEDDEEGLNENAVTRFDNLITITNNGERDSENIEVTISADDDDMFLAYEGDNEDAEINEITLDDDELHVGFQFDTGAGDNIEDIDTIEIEATETSTEG
ncbi:hypothetical protein [Natronorubrum daqingense]|uniref:DUF1102 domain-containing protein n=1 Tax=Natronorubrum daqingense TaxID=588898 RepID=A0A1N7AMG8_9EURY|nr:hypothetical protein [Natronorubrum daqingense]SIR40340.1 Protein of unknown function [Natronorubrum daqingense]